MTVRFFLFLQVSYNVDDVTGKQNHIRNEVFVMRQKHKCNMMVTALLTLASIAFTVIVKAVDVQPIGPEQSRVGLAALNRFMSDLLGVNLFWYHVTDMIGLAAIAVAFCFALVGLLQLLKRKSIKKVDKSILALGVFYIVTIVFYVGFEICAVNFRPILMEGRLEASYPSSHTMIVYCIMASAIVQFHILCRRRRARMVFDTASVIIIAVTVIGRLISGVHWFSDIIGGLLIGSALVMGYYTAAVRLERRDCQ